MLNGIATGRDVEWEPLVDYRRNDVSETTIHGERVFALRFLQARNPDWVGRPFFAKYDEKATWLDGLTPAFGEDKFFFERDAAANEPRRLPVIKS